MNNTTLITILVCAFIVIFIMMVFILVKLNKNNNVNTDNEIRHLNDSFNQNLSQLSNRINDTINSLKDNTNDKLLNLTSSISRVDEAQNSLKNLSLDIKSLTDIFIDKKTRGNFGETELYSILSSVYGDPGLYWDKQYGFENNGMHVIADSVIFGFKNKEILCVDSKFPLENYLRMNDETLPDDDRKDAISDFKKNVKKHIDDINSKYILDGVTADCAFMFLPSEAMYIQIYNSFPDLVEYSYNKRVFFTSPTTLFAYIDAIKKLYIEFKKEQNVNQILSQLKALADDFKRFETRNKELYDELLKFGKKYKDFNITTEKITKQFDKINNIDDSSNN